MFKDRYDLEVSCSSEAALTAYASGIDCALRLDESGIPSLRDAIALDEEFALAHAALGRQLQIHGFRQEAVQHLNQSVLLRAAVTPREQSAIDVITASAAFKPNAQALAEVHVAKFPRDIFVLSHLVGPFGLLAFSGELNWRAQNMELLRATQAAYAADDWWHMTTRSFMGAEVGDLDQARHDGERAWGLNQNGNCAHTLAHVHFETNSANEGRTFIEQWCKTDTDTSDMRHHLIWHLSLLPKGKDSEDPLRIFARELDAEISDPMPLTTFSDNASFLWRCKLADTEVPLELCDDLVRYADLHYPASGFAFADIHRIMAEALLHDPDRQQRLIDELTLKAKESPTQIAVCMLEFAKGFNAFSNGDYVDAANLLEPVSQFSALLGGSNPQREIVQQTYMETCKRAGLS